MLTWRRPDFVTDLDACHRDVAATAYMNLPACMALTKSGNFRWQTPIKLYKYLILLAHRAGFEPTTPKFVVWCSIQLSYRCFQEKMPAKSGRCVSSIDQPRGQATCPDSPRLNENIDSEFPQMSPHSVSVRSATSRPAAASCWVAGRPWTCRSACGWPMSEDARRSSGAPGPIHNLGTPQLDSLSDHSIAADLAVASHSRSAFSSSSACGLGRASCSL